MPIISIHEEVAILVAKKYYFLNTSDFYLGVLAPDTVNLNGFADKDSRWTAHQRKKDLNEWRNSVYNFYQQEQNNYPKEFLLGYVTHILTDIIYDDYFYDEIKRLEYKNNISDEDIHLEQGYDMERYSSISKYKEDIRNKLNSIEKFYNILNITENEMKLFRDKQLKYNYEEIKPIYITEKLLETLANSVIIELTNYIK